ncbi:MAG: hypothetical protein SCALA702_11000 [Melioribacteraceae bacterium]|nr:MAG: hypothetical protein SCALA702_11000 [Melioribacteraceae bacterium]
MYSIFSSEIVVRPDDIDMNNHVHYTKYLDYLLAARYEQMERDYKMSMEEFIERDLTWVASTAHIEYKRALKLNDIAVVKTQLESFSGAKCRVNFWIEIKATGKPASSGYVDYTLVSIKSGRPARLTDDIIEKYAI